MDAQLQNQPLTPNPCSVYTLTSNLYSGSFSQIKLTTSSVFPKRKFVTKIIGLSSNTINSVLELPKNFKNEVKVLEGLPSHQNIPIYYQHYFANESLNLVFELFENSENITQIFKKRGRF